MLCRMFWNPKQNKTKWFRNKKYSYKCKQKRETMSCELFQISHKLNHLNQTKQKNFKYNPKTYFGLMRNH